MGFGNFNPHYEIELRDEGWNDNKIWSFTWFNI